jgi:hypothetical protein
VTIDELTLLRSALAELPDLVPSRRLRLLPPAPEPRATSTAGWLRRLSAPIMAAGLGLVLIGAVGTSGMLDGFAPAGGAAVFAPVGQDLREGAGDVAPTASARVPEPTGSRLGTADGLGSQPPPTVVDNSGSASGASPSATVRAPAAPTASAADLGSLGTDQSAAPWLALLLAGVAFVVAGGVLRFSAPHS